MDLINALVISAVSFAFGLIATSYGVKIGKKAEARHKQLNEMADWVDNILAIMFALNLYEEETFKPEHQKLIDKFMNTYSRATRIEALADQDKIGSKKLSSAIVEFSDLFRDFMMISPVSNKENEDSPSFDMTEFYKDIYESAYKAHLEIANLKSKG